MIQVSELHAYPIKSARGISLPEAVLDERGLQGDRRLMLVDDDGVFLSQRTRPEMARIIIAREGQAWRITAPGRQPLHVPLRPVSTERTTVQVWGDRCRAATVGGDCDAWFREFLGVNCRLVYQPDEAERPVDTRYAAPGTQVSFSDGFPLLLISQASLDDLNSRLETPVPMNRFRPNLVVSGCDAFAEDAWRTLRVGDAMFQIVKPCARCRIIGIDQDSGVFSKEPMRVLAGYRNQEHGVMFGQNLTHSGTGVLRVGDQVHVESSA
ncbi:MAG: MOSC domain-containing protein [Planctomycetales bacterium]